MTTARRFNKYMVLLALIAFNGPSVVASYSQEEEKQQQQQQQQASCEDTKDKERGEDNILEHARDLIQWLRDGGGFFHDNLEIRRRVPGDPTSPSGIFVRKDGTSIAPGEVIVQVPRELYLTIPREEVYKPSNYFSEPMIHDEDDEDDDDDDDGIYFSEPIIHDEDDEEDDEDDDGDEEEDVSDSDEEYEDFHTNTCRLSKELLKETKLYHESPSLTRYAPYIRYLEETQPKGQLPATYSENGKKLLRRIQGMDDVGEGFSSPNYKTSPLPPLDLVDWIDSNHLEKHCLNATDTDNYHAVALTIQRGFDLELIPVWDMVNHNIEERVNVETNSIRSEEGLKVWAEGSIAAGEEIFYSYNYCEDCFDMGDLWGTPGIYRDFGFLEEYPQEWPFLDQYVFAQIRRDESRPGHFYAHFYATFNSDMDSDFSPDGEALEFFREQLSRLRRLDIEQPIEELSSPLERTMIRQYYDSLRIAISSIVDASEQQQQQRSEL